MNATNDKSDERHLNFRAYATLVEVERFRSHCAVEAMKIFLTKNDTRESEVSTMVEDSFRIANAMVNERAKHSGRKVRAP